MPLHRCVKLSPFSRWIIMQLLRRTCNESEIRCCQDLVDSITAECEHRALRESFFFCNSVFCQKNQGRILFQDLAFIPTINQTLHHFSVLFAQLQRPCARTTLTERETVRLKSALRMKLCISYHWTGEEGRILVFVPVNDEVFFKKKRQLSQKIYNTRRTCFPINSRSPPDLVRRVARKSILAHLSSPPFGVSNV